MARNDVHSPANLVTEDYEYILSADNSPDMGPGWVLQYGDFGLEVSRRLAATDRLGRSVHQCHHCGARIRYFSILKHVPTGDYIAVGETCMSDRFELATAEFHKLRKAAELDRQARRIREAVAEFVQANPDLAFMGVKKFEERQAQMPETSRENSFIHDVASKLNQYGSLSERQVAAVRTAVARDAERAAALATREVEVFAPVVEGRIVITGEVLSVKWQDSDYGGSLKMLVKDDRNFKVWGTVPSSIEVERGNRVTFTATVEQSKDDETFGFFKRPSKATNLTPQETN